MKVFRRVHNVYSVSQLLCDESFVDWVLQGKNPNNDWYRRFENQKRMTEVSRKAEIIIKRLSHSETVLTDTSRMESIKAKIDADIARVELKDSFGKYEHSSSRKTWRKILPIIAASLVLMILSGVYFLGLRKEEKQVALEMTQETKSTENGQKLTIHLSDGSIVRLNSGSKIAYQKYFTDSSRVIHLSGEAFFEVAKDTLRPFQVISGNSMTQALGTSFNIKNINEEVTIALLTGKVSVSELQGEETTMLTPGQKTVASGDGLSEIKHWTYGDEFAWKDDVLIFKNARGKEIFDELEKWYGVTIKVQPYLNEQSWNYTGKFNKKSLRHVLENISFVENFDFDINNKQVLIKSLRK